MGLQVAENIEGRVFVEMADIPAYLHAHGNELEENW